MSEKTELNVASKESVALELARQISSQENLHYNKDTYRKEYLDLYAECLEATHGRRSTSQN